MKTSQDTINNTTKSFQTQYDGYCDGADKDGGFPNFDIYTRYIFLNVSNEDILCIQHTFHAIWELYSDVMVFDPEYPGQISKRELHIRKDRWDKRYKEDAIKYNWDD